MKKFTPRILVVIGMLAAIGINIRAGYWVGIIFGIVLLLLFVWATRKPEYQLHWKTNRKSKNE